MSASKFDLSVYQVVSRIPRGRVATYAGVAKALDCRSPRAIGQALRRNPFAPGVPCHRVISSSLCLGGFQGHRQGTAIAAKAGLLQREGVGFDAKGRLLEPARVVAPDRLKAEAIHGVLE
jgi:methylated-DNA-[protein]-cysteine S-methyltransferase